MHKAGHGLRFAFGELLDDIGPLLLLGIGIAGAIARLVPDGFLERGLGDGILPMLVMLVVGIPIYVCATASTPIVAALALKGLSPGAALVFLLAGPATNAATITIVSQIMGKRVAAVYVSVIAAVALLLGLAVNEIYFSLSISVTDWVAETAHPEHGLWTAAAAILLIGLIARARLTRFRQKSVAG